MSIIEEVKQRSDIIEVINEYTTLKKAGRLYRGLCPFHSEKTPSFFVYPEEQTWHCFGSCNTGGDVFSFIMKKQSVGFGEALQLLADRKGIKVPLHTGNTESKSEKERLYEINQAAAQYYNNIFLNDSSAAPVREYLKKRGVSSNTAVLFQLGYAPNSWDALQRHLTTAGFNENEILNSGLIIKSDEGKTHDRFRHKLMIPICDVKGRVSGFGSRVLDDSQPKYINSSQTAVFDKSGSLYGINHAANIIRTKDRAIIVEGYMDVIIAHQYGEDNVIASMGTSITEKQIAIIKRLTRNVYLALDPDSAGEEAMLRGVNYENELEAEVKVILLPEGKDPDEVIKEDQQKWAGLVEAAIPVVDYTFRTVTAGLNLAKLQDKTVAAEKLLPIIAGINNDIRRDHYLNRLAEMTNTTYRSMEMALGKIATPRRTLRVNDSAKKNSGKLIVNPIEEYVLSLLLQHPELKDTAEPIPVEYFENSENREIYQLWLESTDIARLQEALDISIKEHFELILGKKIAEERIDKKYSESSLRLREKYLKNLKRQEEQVLNLERESGGTDAELARLLVQGTEVSEDLKQVFIQRGQNQKR